MSGLRTGFTSERDPDRAVEALWQTLEQDGCCLAVLFCSPEYQTSGFAEATARVFGEVPVIGCTTSGELTPSGYSENSIVGLSFAAPDFHAVSTRIDDMKHFDLAESRSMVSALKAELAEGIRGDQPHETVALLLIDDSVRREEAVVAALHTALEGVPLIGGSAGAGLDLERTSVLADGTFSEGGAVLALLATDRPLKLFRSQHFVASDTKLVVTEVDTTQRQVFEINAEPAVDEYARVIGVDVADLTAMHFATHPLVVRLGGSEYVRSILRANDDGSLTFACAIDEGLVLTLAEGRDMIAHLDGLFGEIREEIGPPEIVLALDCVLRRFELEQVQQMNRVKPLFAANNVVGFSTFGEQFGAMHVNQTFTGMAIGRRPDP